MIDFVKVCYFAFLVGKGLLKENSSQLLHSAVLIVLLVKR